MDFILTDRKGSPTAVECKWSASEFEATNIKAFRRVYDKGDNFVVANDVKRPYFREFEGVQDRFVGLRDLIDEIL